MSYLSAVVEKLAKFFSGYFLAYPEHRKISFPANLNVKMKHKPLRVYCIA